MLTMSRDLRVSVLALWLGLFAALIGGCGESSPGGPGAAALAGMFKDGSIVNHMSDDEKIAFSSMGGKGFRARGRYVFEGTGGVQYRIVRSEWVELIAKELEEKTTVGKPVRDRVSEGEITAVAVITLERLPGKKYLEENASEIIAKGIGGRVQVVYTLVRDGKKKWSIAKEGTYEAAQGLFKTYEGNKELRTKISRTELAKRLVTTAPKPPPEPAPAPQGG